MTRETAKGFLPIFQAFGEGKTIQVRFDGSAKWTECLSLFGDPRGEYRVKPEKPVIWALMDLDNNLYSITYNTEADARNALCRLAPSSYLVTKFVISDE